MCLSHEDNTVFLSLKQILDLFYEIGPPKSFLLGAVRDFPSAEQI